MLRSLFFRSSTVLSVSGCCLLPAVAAAARQARTRKRRASPWSILSSAA